MAFIIDYNNLDVKEKIAKGKMLVQSLFVTIQRNQKRRGPPNISRKL